MSKGETIASNYKTPGHPTAFSAIANLQKFYPFLTKQKLEHELSKIDSFTLHKKTVKPRYNPVYVHKRRHLMEIDLIDISGLKRWNDGVTFLLVLIDCFSRFICIEALTSKNGVTVARALNHIFESRLPPPVGKTYRFDRGLEFLNSHVKRLLQDKGITIIHPGNKPTHVERVNRTVQNLIYEYMEEHETKRYIDQLQKIVKSYNTRPHRAIQMTPTEADLPTNQLLVRKALALYYSKREKKLGKQQKPKFKIGQAVRIKASRGIFARGYEPLFKHEGFRIKEIITKFPRLMYKLTDWDDTEEIEGLFYGEEIVAYNVETFKIEKILDTRVHKRRPESLVKWVGFKRATWEPTASVQNL